MATSASTLDILLTLPEELQLLKSELRQFVNERVEPRSVEIEATDEIPPDLLDEARKLGLFGLMIPEQYGGLGLTLTGKCVVEEELGRSSYGFATLIGNHTGISSMGIVEFGSDEQRVRYLPRMATGEVIGAFALSEAGAGSDPSDLRTFAGRRGDGWVLTGEKLFITNAPEASVFTVMARTDRSQSIRGISAFLVERAWSGVSVGPKEAKMGMRGGHTATVSFDAVIVPGQSLLGKEGQGFTAALKVLTKGRVTLSARCVGMAERLLEKCVAHARQRVQFGRPIVDYQAIQIKLADMALGVQAARLLTYHAAAAIEQGRPAVKEAAMAKLYASEMVCRVADEAVQIHGGMGYMKELDVERYYRDARITKIYEGTSEIQRLIIAREITGSELRG